MKFQKVVTTSLVIFLFLSMGLVSPAGQVLASSASTVSPSIVMGPQATPANVANPAYGLFTCQVVGLRPYSCYDPYQMRKAYNIDSLISAGYTGAGKTIVIVDAFQDPNIVNQLNYFDNFYGLPGLNGLGNPSDPSLGTFTQVAPDGLTPFDLNDGNMVGWAEEISLDVLWAHAIAPGANITLVLAASNNDSDILSATKSAVDNNLGDVISQSFGENESCVPADVLPAEHQVFADATLKGITIFASSADQGAALQTCDGSSWVKAVSSPASDPLVTAVGGTLLTAAKYCLPSLGCDPTANPAPGTYQGEVAWNELGNSVATGGGFSVLYNEPAYQQGTLPGGKQAGVPDIAYNAGIYTGVLTWIDIPGANTGWYLFGGTSAGSPQWAAITAIADQKAGHDLGFINTALYHIGQAQQKYAASLHDITSGNNSVVEDGVTVQGYEAGPGWDAATGLGTPKTNTLVNNLIQLVSPGDGVAAVAGSMPHPHGTPPVSGQVKPH